MLMMNVDDEDDQTRNTRKYVQYRTHARTVHALLCMNAAQRSNLYYVNTVQYIFRRKDVVVIKKNVHELLRSASINVSMNTFVS